MATIQCTVQRSSWYEVYFEYSYTQDKTSAKTTLTHSLKLKQITDSYDFDTVGSVTVGYTVSGQTFSKAGRIDIDDKGNKGYTITLASGTSTITHNQSTGEGSFTVAVDTSIDSAGYGPGTIKLASKTVSLPTIYRASKPTVSASTVKMGNTLTIYTNRKSSSFTHTLTVTMGGGTGTIATGVGDSYEWTVWDISDKCNNATSGTATITCTTYNGSATVGTKTCTVTLTVPNESNPTASDVVMGNSVTVKTNRKSTFFTHTIELWFAGNKINARTGVGDSTSFDVPIGLAGLIKSDPYGTATIKCITYNGTAKVGEDQTTFIATVPDDNTTKPQFTESDFALEATGNLPSAFSGLFIQGKTGVKASFRATSYYSTISKYELYVDGRVYTGNPATSNVITTDGAIRAYGTVTDARGYFKEVYKTITVIPYKTPTIERSDRNSSVICERSTQDGTYDDAGTHLHIECKRSYSSVNGKNTCTLQYQYKAQGGTWSSPKTLLDGADTSTDAYEGIVPDVVLGTANSYVVKLIVKDAVGSEETYDFPISTADVTMHLGYGGYGVAFGKYSEATAENKMVELDDDWSLVMHGEAVADFVVEEGNDPSGVWSYRKWNSGRCELYGYHQATGAVEVQSGNVYRSNAIYANLPFRVYDLTLAVDCCEINARASAVTYRADEGNASVAYVIWRGGAYTDTSTNWTSYIHVSGRWK